MILETVTTSIFLKQILNVYKQVSDSGVSGIIVDRIVFLENLLSGEEKIQKLKKNELPELFRIIFDAQILVGSSYSFKHLSLLDANLLGFKDLKNINKSQQEDWLMQMKIQSWLHFKGMPPLHDLRADVDHSVCEYRFNNLSEDHLVECKNLHIGGSKDPDVLINKMLEKISSNQLGKSEKQFNIHALKTMYVDISNYANQNLSITSKCGIEILAPDETFLQQLSENIDKYVFNSEEVELDSFILCWDEYYYFNNQPIVLLYNARHFGKKTDFIFDGLSLEMFPMKGKKTIFSEIRFRVNILDRNYPAEIRTTLNNLLSPETFFKIVGEEKNR